MCYNSLTIIKEGAIVGEGTIIDEFTIISSGAVVGNNCKIHRNVFIDDGVVIGDNVKIQDNVMIPSGVTIADGVFIGPGVAFTNDKYPRAINSDGSLKQSGDWVCSETKVEYGASIGANATIVCGITLGKWSMVGAGAVVTKDVAERELVIGNPARVCRLLDI